MGAGREALVQSPGAAALNMAFQPPATCFLAWLCLPQEHPACSPPPGMVSPWQSEVPLPASPSTSFLGLRRGHLRVTRGHHSCIPPPPHPGPCRIRGAASLPLWIFGGVPGPAAGGFSPAGQRRNTPGPASSFSCLSSVTLATTHCLQHPESCWGRSSSHSARGDREEEVALGLSSEPTGADNRGETSGLFRGPAVVASLCHAQ